MIHETLGEDLQGFVRLLEGICKDLQDFGRGLHKIHDLQDFGQDL